MGTQWDKRRSYGNWVGYARLLALRASRRLAGLSSIETSPELPPTAGGLPLVSLKTLVAQLP